jgi:type I restriction enzyme S subunit
MLNKKINDNLSNQMQVLFNYWFTQFNFPNSDGKPYKASGGTMQFNKELGRLIPAGWTAGSLRSVIDIFQTRISPETIGNRLYIPIEVIPRHQISFYKTADMDKAASGLCSFNRKDILLSNRRVYFHKVCISPFDGITRDTVITIKPKIKENLGYVFQYLFSDAFIKYATINSYGSEQPVLSPQTVLDYKIPLPPQDLDKKYSDLVKNSIDQILLNEVENRNLSIIREDILPLLMSGQATIAD